MSWDTQVRFIGAYTKEQEDQFFELLNEEFLKLHSHLDGPPHGLNYIPRDRFPDMDAAIIYAPCHWNFGHTQQTEKDLHLAADQLEVRVETYQSGNAHCTEWSDRETVMQGKQVFHW